VSGLTPGTDYFVRVYSNSNNTTAFRIGITEGLVNDECAGALPLPVLYPDQIAVQRKENTRDASISTGSCAQLFPDLWYTFTATDDEATFVAAYEGSNVDAYTELFSGTCGSLTSLWLREQQPEPIHWADTRRHLPRTLRQLQPGRLCTAHRAGAQ
jgi:hypothetical protein